MDIVKLEFDIEPQLSALIKSNLVGLGLSPEVMEKVTHFITSDIAYLLSNLCNKEEE